MSWFEALILGIVQGLTEYLPVSSSGHLAIGSALFGIEGEENLAFTIVVHVATVFSTLVVLWKEIDWIFRGLFKFQMNAETKYVINILISMEGHQGSARCLYRYARSHIRNTCGIQDVPYSGCRCSGHVHRAGSHRGKSLRNQSVRRICHYRLGGRR